MSLVACPVCGYAVSTMDSRCRHCPTGPTLGKFRTMSAARMAQIGGVAAITATLIYVLFFR